ncbi:hypothetical protein Nepgr_007171 [Nepenthes gracilis]|uniref:NADP-dependent oxidoreductase domain-containing protein n=1 Tax=Nepenthes gracilis TaxID=150966 RepID=A0AAD3S765_NEPGR|nr:hypothetical protein Nepgr_007171 [Nepenthes gracilis]
MASFQLYKGIAEFMQGVAFQKNLQLDYIDLYIIQWPVRKKKNFITSELENTIPVDIPSTWKTMKAVYDSGKAKVLDISKLYMKELGELLAIARVPPAINRAQCHPSWQQNKPHEFQSPVFVRAKERSTEVAYLEDMYERKREHKKVHVRWFLMLTVKIFNIDTNVVQETGRTRNVREQQYFLKIHSGTEHGKKTTYEQLCQDITYYMSGRGLFLPLNVEKAVFIEAMASGYRKFQSFFGDAHGSSISHHSVDSLVYSWIFFGYYWPPLENELTWTFAIMSPSSLHPIRISRPPRKM